MGLAHQKSIAKPVLKLKENVLLPIVTYTLIDNKKSAR